jgi:signal transduction histidine kinase
LSDDFTRGQVAVLVDLDPTMGEVPHDPAMIRNVVLNLAHNAIQAMSGGGALMLKTQDRGNWVRLRLADTGTGMNRDLLRRIWTPFFTTKIHGSGLGLPVVQKVIDAHRGRVIVRSKPDRGTIFDLQLPKTDATLPE